LQQKLLYHVTLEQSQILLFLNCAGNVEKGVFTLKGELQMVGID
jgi:hypothetical protein